MAALMWAGRALLWLLAVLLALVLAALLIPVSVWLEYSGGMFRLSAGMLFVKIPILPRKPLTEQQKKRRAEKAARKAQKKRRTQKPPPPQTQAKPARQKAKLTVDALCTMAGAAGRFLRAVLGALRITHIRICLPVSGQDAADTAVQYGQTNAWLHTALAFLNRVFWLEFDQVRIEPDFTGNLAGSEVFSCKVSARLIIMGIAGAAFVYTLFREKILDIFL